MAATDPVRELFDLAAVHGFYVTILEQKLGHTIPRPKEQENPNRHEPKIMHSIQLLRHWLAVLDLAVPALSIRDALKENLPEETAEALMRYFIDKGSHGENDRDKADFMGTFLYRNSKVANSNPPDTADRYFFICQTADKFEEELNVILGDAEVPELKPEHSQLIKEFEFLHSEVEDFRTFDQLMDSGIVARVRDIKLSFGESFYHPKVIAHVAVYNAMFGKRFDELLHVTTEQLKSFAAQVQDEGASIQSKLEGDVTVKHIADIEVDAIKTQEYGKAQEHFHKISKFKKVVDKSGRGRGRTTGAPIPPKTPFSHAPDLKVASDRSTTAGRTTAVPSAPRPAPAQPSLIASTVASELEEGKTRSQMETIRTFVRVADKSCFVVPLVKGSIKITAPEAESLRAEFGSEKSFRADYANLMSYMVALMARLEIEGHHFREKQSSSYLWKPHADSITYALNSQNRICDRAAQMSDLARKRGLTDKARAIETTVLRFREDLQKAAALLQSAGSRG